MYNFTKETIINSFSTSNYTVANGKINIKRVGEYKKANVVDGKVYKTAGVAGSVSTLAITVPTLTAGDYVFSMFARYSSKFLGEFANANYAEFQKPILCGFTAVGTAATDATSLYKSVKSIIPEDNAFLSVSVSGAVVTITMSNPYLHFYGYGLSLYDATNDKYTSVTATMVKTESVEPFATGDWIIENLRFPSYPNIRYAGVNADERPVPGVLYTQYVFSYSVVRDINGVSAVGQKVESVTNHVFYVAAGAVSAFETALAAVGLLLSIPKPVAVSGTLSAATVFATASSITTSNSAVASVSGTTITGVAAGTAIITVSDSGSDVVGYIEVNVA